MKSPPTGRPTCVVRGVILLVNAERELARWPLDVGDEAIDMSAVDRLARLQLAAKRLGCELRFADLCPRLRDLLDLAGLGDWIEVQG